MTNITSASGGWQSPEAYCEHVAHYLSIGWEPVLPSTVAELHAALDEFPEYARRWLPTPAECERLGIDASIGQPVAALNEREQERLLVTLRDDDEFRVAFRALLIGGLSE